MSRRRRDRIITLTPVLALALALSVSGAGGCARDAAQVVWDEAFDDAGRLARGGDDTRTASAAAAYAALSADAPRPIDAAAAALERGALLRDRGDLGGALTVWLALGEGAERRADRARARYAIARLLEAEGRTLAAVRLYRRLVRTYPDLMPGERSLAHLERLLAARGDHGVEAHLTWTRAVYPSLAHTSLADNLVYYPARLAHERFRATGDASWAALAEDLYRRIDEAHPTSGLWNDAWWDRSLLYHRQRRHAEEVAAIERILQTRRAVSLFGHDEHTYFWQGQMRVARLEQRVLDRPDEAAARLTWFIDRYPDSVWLDDALYWRGCVLLAAGRAADAEASFARVAEVYADSKYLARIALARSDPRGQHCAIPDFVAGQW